MKINCPSCDHNIEVIKKRKKHVKTKPCINPVIDGEKKCIICDVVKSADAFNKRTSGILKAECKSCQKIRNQIYYKNKSK